MSPRATEKPPRRTQAERSAQTRRRLCDAVVATLAEGGYAGTSTAEVAARAGLSQGAVFRHYPTKAHLLAAAAEQLYDDLRAAYRAAIDEAAGADDIADALIRRLWEVFQGEEMIASNELVVAARTDGALRTALRPVLARNAAANQHLAAELLPPPGLAPGLVDTVLWAMQGAAMDAHVVDDPEAVRAFLDTLVALARSLLEAPPA